MPVLTSNGPAPALLIRDKDVAVFASGTWGSGTLNIQTYGDDDAWHTVLTMTADGTQAFINKGLHRWRINLSGATSPFLWAHLRGAGIAVAATEDGHVLSGTLSITGYAPTPVVT